MRKVLVTGGSGFIGTNLVESLLAGGDEVLSCDLQPPQNPNHSYVYRRMDIMDAPAVNSAFESFAPSHVVHLAARTDLNEKKSLEGYDVNIQGVTNIIEAVSHQNSVERAIFTSTKLVCPTDYHPQSTDDYCPDTLYGQSKYLGEELVKNSKVLHCPWCIVRPTSIWGPWADIPYGRFFRTIAKGLYFHPGRIDPPKSFGYVGNVVFQIEKLMDAPPEQIDRGVFYASDYDTFTIRQWADTISIQMRGRKVRTIPEPIVRLLALIGDIAKLCGFKEPPLSSFRLRNMRADTSGVPTEPIRSLTGPLPYTVEEGVKETIAWLRSSRN